MQQEIARDLYEILATREDASDEEIKRAFRRAALVSHPDRNPGKAETEERFKEANFAYYVLGNPERRRRYDHYREFMLLLSHWGIRSWTGQEKFLEDLFLQAEIPALAQSLLASLRHTRLGKGRGSPPSLPGISLLLVARLLQSIVREVRSRRGSILLSKPLPSFSLHRARTRLHFLLRLLQAVLVPASGSERRTSSSSAEEAIFEGADIDWPLVLTREEAAAGRLLRVSFLQDSRWARTDLRVPAGVEDGKRIRLRGSGNRIPGTGRRGDLYLRIAIQSER